MRMPQQFSNAMERRLARYSWSGRLVPSCVRALRRATPVPTTMCGFYHPPADHYLLPLHQVSKLSQLAGADTIDLRNKILRLVADNEGDIKKYWKGAANPRTQELEMEDLAKIQGRDSEVGKERLLRIFANLNTDLQGGISFDELQDFIRGPKATTPGVGKKDN